MSGQQGVTIVIHGHGIDATEKHQFPEQGGSRFGVLNLRLTPREAAVLRFCGDNGKKSQHQIILDVALLAIQNEYRKITGDHDFVL